MAPSAERSSRVGLHGAALAVLLVGILLTSSVGANPKSGRDPACGPSPSATSNAKLDLFPLTPSDVALLNGTCNGKIHNDKFHPCPVKGSCAYEANANEWKDGGKCAPADPTTCRSVGSTCSQPHGCGEAVIIKFAQGDIDSCNSGPGSGSAQGNGNSNPNSQAFYLCAKTASDAAGCAAECAKYQDGGAKASDPFKCKSWLLIAPNDPTENTQCNTSSAAPGRGWENQEGQCPEVVTPYYGGCGWCFLLRDDVCAPTCSSWGLDSACGDGSGDHKQNIYWALHGRTGCAYGKDDPHFEGADGTRFEFNGVPEKSFCLVSDDSLHMNMKMQGYYDTRTAGATVLRSGKALRTWIREIGLIWKDPRSTPKGSSKDPAKRGVHTLHLVARKGPEEKRGAGFLEMVEVDGTAAALPQDGTEVSFGGGLSMAFKGAEGHGRWVQERYQISIAGLIDFQIALRPAHALLRTPLDAFVHFNILIDDLHASPALHGILGQTFRAGRTARAVPYKALSALLGHPFAADSHAGMGYLDGTPKDYITSSVLAPDCKFTQLHA